MYANTEEMKMKDIFNKSILVMLILLITGFLAACGGAASEPAPAAPQEPAAEEPAEESAAEEPAEEPAGDTDAPSATLVIWADETRASIIQDVGEKFQEEAGIEVNVQLISFDDIRSRLTTAAPQGEGPDLFLGAHDWQGELVVSGILAPIDLGDQRDQFLDLALEAFTFDGSLYGMPYATENVAFIRNTDLVPDAPTTWSEVATLAAELDASGKQAYILQEDDAYHYNPILSAFGGYVFGQDDAGNYDPSDVGLDSEGSLAAATWLEMMVSEGYLKGGVDWDTAHVAFENSDAAMIITGPWALDRIKQSGVPYAISPIPGETEAGSPFLGVQGFMINNFSDNKLLAQEFLTKFIATEEVMQQLYEAQPRTPAFLPTLESIDDPDVTAFAEAGQAAQPMPAIPEMAAVWDSFSNAITLVLQDQSSGSDAFTNAAEQVRTAIESSE